MCRRLQTTVVLLALAVSCSPAPPRARRQLDIVDVLRGAGTAGFARALEPRPLVFPADHGSHPDFASEWWYFTGNLDGESGERFGFQLTFFRTALQPPTLAPVRPSAWATDQVWMAHFAVTDVGGGRFHAFQRFQRGALDLAGAQARPWRVWLDDWRLEQLGADPFPLRLSVGREYDELGEAAEAVAIDLTLDAAKPVVLHGQEGLSRKGPTPGNASFYYSFTRLSAAGTVRVGGRQRPVTGSAWLDREWSSGVLEAGQVGWDWFALQLDDGSELMYYQLRDAGGRASPYSAGTLVRADGTSTPLPAEVVRLLVEDTWTSPRDAVVYPSRWALSIPREGIELSIVPVRNDQELDLAFRYWEGAVDVSGTGFDGRVVGGRGYVELTGYAGSGPQR